ncbi:MAG: hypothetical protein WKF71_17530 [Pyrinomonadaceae bacterium]
MDFNLFSDLGDSIHFVFSIYFFELDYDLARLIKVVFMGFGLTCFLLAVMGITGLYFMGKLKEVTLTGWKLFIGFYILFSALVLPRIGNVLVVADEGWLGFYKHPLVWVVIAFLIGNFILSRLKTRKNHLS